MGNVSQRTSTGEPRQTGTFWDAVEENVEDQDPEYEYEDDEQEETTAAPTRRRPRRNILDDEDEESEEEEEPFNTPESSAEHALFITQQDPEPYHEPGTLSRSQKGKTPAARKRPSSSTNIWASFSLTTDTSTSAANPAPMAKKKAMAGRGRGTKPTTRGTTRGWGRGTRGKRGQATGRHIHFE